MFEDLELPDLERKALRQLEAPRSSKRKGYRQVGIRIRLDKRRTVARAREAPKRGRGAASAIDADAPQSPARRRRTRRERRFPFHDDDLVYRHVTTDDAQASRTPSSSASWTPRGRWTR